MPRPGKTTLRREAFYVITPFEKLQKIAPIVDLPPKQASHLAQTQSARGGLPGLTIFLGPLYTASSPEN